MTQTRKRAAYTMAPGVAKSLRREMRKRRKPAFIYDDDFAMSRELRGFITAISIVLGVEPPPQWPKPLPALTSTKAYLALGSIMRQKASEQ